MAFNSPLSALQEPVHDHPDGYFEKGKQWGPPSEYSFIKTGSDHVMLYALKHMEGFYSTDPILRFFEFEGREGEVNLELPFQARVVETNLLEDTLGPVAEGRTIRFRMKPWEIKTLRLTALEHADWPTPSVIWEPSDEPYQTHLKDRGYY
jgi:alpha-mannosidase